MEQAAEHDVSFNDKKTEKIGLKITEDAVEEIMLTESDDRINAVLKRFSGEDLDLRGASKLTEDAEDAVVEISITKSDGRIMKSTKKGSRRLGVFKEGFRGGSRARFKRGN